MGTFSSKNEMPVNGKTILITGSSEGLGRSVACQLAAKGANLVLVSRGVPKLEETLAAVKRAAKNPETQRFRYISADVSKPDYARGLIAKAVAWNDGKPLDIVWTIAGQSTPDFWVEAPLSVSRNQMDINYWGSAEMAHAILREWTAPEVPVVPEPKHLIFTSSVLAFTPIVGYGPYNPTKAALRALGDTLVQELELYPQKVKIHVVFPGGISSPGFDRENLTKPEITVQLEADDPVQTPDEVASKAIKGLERGDYSVIVSWYGYILKCLALGSAPRESWILDGITSCLMQVIFFFALLDISSKIRKYAKKNGHPVNYRKQQSEVEGGR
ncbi:hypothetical protein LQW54_009700 [Pestalotiopsis sp. IQ-011]